MNCGEGFVAINKRHWSSLSTISALDFCCFIVDFHSILQPTVPHSTKLHFNDTSPLNAWLYVAYAHMKLAAEHSLARTSNGNGGTRFAASTMCLSRVDSMLEKDQHVRSLDQELEYVL